MYIPHPSASSLWKHPSKISGNPNGPAERTRLGSTRPQGSPSNCAGRACNRPNRALRHRRPSPPPMASRPKRRTHSRPSLTGVRQCADPGPDSAASTQPASAAALAPSFGRGQAAAVTASGGSCRPYGRQSGAARPARRSQSGASCAQSRLSRFSSWQRSIGQNVEAGTPTRADRCLGLSWFGDAASRFLFDAGTGVPRGAPQSDRTIADPGSVAMIRLREGVP